jgi:hypothetical protein
MHKLLVPAICLALPLGACNGEGESVQSTGNAAVESVKSVPALVNVDLRDVLNDLSLDLNLDRANVPVNAQIPITLAANVCGVSINVLSASTGGQANCTAKTSSPELAQVVQQQVAAGGSVGGGDQGGSTATNSGATTTAADATSDAGTAASPTPTSSASEGATPSSP